LPIKTDDGSIINLFRITFGVKPDMRKLVPLFSPAYVKIYEFYPDHKNKLKGQTAHAILVGNDDHSDSRLFCNPNTSRLMGSSDYIIDEHMSSDSAFNLPYSENICFNTYATDQLKFPSHNVGDTIFTLASHPTHPVKKATVLAALFNGSEYYSVSIEGSNNIIDIALSFLTTIDPSNEFIDSSPSIRHTWYKHKAPTTLFLPDVMSEPKQGTIIYEDSVYKFRIGRGTKSISGKEPSYINLSYNPINIDNLILNGNLVEGRRVRLCS
jgi:hypothetical protein